jgi:neurofibromin 1
LTSPVSEPDQQDAANIQPFFAKQLQPSSKSAELHDLVIIGLTHLVSANIESGFKQCQPLAYDQDSRKRTIFAHVFARVIGQGTVFNAKDKSVLKARFQGLYEVSISSFPSDSSSQLIR